VVRQVAEARAVDAQRPPQGARLDHTLGDDVRVDADLEGLALLLIDRERPRKQRGELCDHGGVVGPSLQFVARHLLTVLLLVGHLRGLTSLRLQQNKGEA
jgi:hypothetical protein